MKTNRLTALAVAVSSVFALSASAAEAEMWNVTFEADSFQAGFPGLTMGELGTLTNDETKAQCVQPYASGVWTAIDSDESYVTNGLATNWVSGAMTEVANATYLKLDTQGNDLTWKPTETTNGVQTLVDVDLFLVGSDSAPTDFDANNDVQAAIYLKNEVDESTQETTNSVLCVYVRESGSNTWVELEGVELYDNSWAHVLVTVDHTDVPNGGQAKVSVSVNDTVMHAVGNVSKTSWTVANPTASTADRINSISFRGTGAVDNFVGRTFVEEVAYCTLTAEAYLDGTRKGTTDAHNPTLIRADVPVGEPYQFVGFAIDDYEEGEETTYALSRIVIYGSDGSNVLATIDYSDYDGEHIDITPSVDDSAYFAWGLDENDDRDGTFKLIVPTTGIADGADLIIAKVYYTSFNPPQPSTPEVDVGEGLAAYKAAHPDADVPDPVAFNETTDLFEVSFVAPQTGRYVLMVCDTIDGTYVEDPGSAENVTTAGEPVTLTESQSSATSKFFKIGYGPAE